MSEQGEEEDVQVEIQKTLSSINDLTIKIKKELTEITDLVREKGRLNTAVNEANEVLFDTAQKMGIDPTVDSTMGEENGDELANLPLPMTLHIISQKILSLFEASQTQ